MNVCLMLLIDIDRQTANAETTANMTNLALKGIIGVKAMVEISRVVGNEIDAQEYDVCSQRSSS